MKLSESAQCNAKMAQYNGTDILAKLIAMHCWTQNSYNNLVRYRGLQCCIHFSSNNSTLRCTVDDDDLYSPHKGHSVRALQKKIKSDTKYKTYPRTALCMARPATAPVEEASNGSWKIGGWGSLRFL